MINKPIDLSSLAYIDVSTGCWLWRGTLSSTGYGAITINKRQYHSHRFSYTLFYGEIPDNLCVMRQRPRFKEKINVD